MSERVLHEWVAHERQQRIIEIDGDRLHQKKIPDGEWRSPAGNTFDWVDELARLAAENAKLRACVEAADAMRVEARCEHENGNDPRENCCDTCWSMIHYGAARAEVDK